MPYSIKEIIDIAISIERTGHDFYAACGKKFNEPLMRDTFDFLAKEELNHLNVFKDMRDAAEPSGLFTEEYYAYLKAIGGRIFEPRVRDIRNLVEGFNSPLDAIRDAFHTEKESILFYTELLPLYQEDSSTSGLLIRIIDEERRHVMTLTDVARGLTRESGLI